MIAIRTLSASEIWAISAILLSAAIGMHSAPVSAGDEPPIASGGAPAADRLREMSRTASAITITCLEGRSGIPTRLIPEPLLRFNDPDRGISDGTLWAWVALGRPVAVLEIYQKFNEPDTYYHALSAASVQRIEAAASGRIFWSPRQPVLAFKRLPDAAAPAETKRVRLSQMKQAATRFAAFEHFDPDRQRSQLRLLTQPVYRYPAPGHGVLDGAVFVLALGTNPEVLLFLEAHRGEDEAPHWKYGLVRRGFAELHVTLDDHEVWSVPRAWESKPDDSMFAFTDLP